MILTPALVEAYQKILQDPEAYDFDFKPINECFVRSETVTANHVLAKNYLDYTARGIPKAILYIIMHELYGVPHGKDGEGYFGYYLTFNPELLPKNDSTM